MEVVIHNKIFEIRGQKVMLDFDLAELYAVETRVFNQAVKRNVESFPDDFMFRLTAEEWHILMSGVTSSNSKTVENQSSSSSQFVMMGKLPLNRTGKYLPYAFTEHGVTMLASVLKSPVARKMSIAIVRAFISLRKIALQYKEIVQTLEELKDRMGGYDTQLNQIYEALETMLDKKMEAENKEAEWKSRERIGFKQKAE